MSINYLTNRYLKPELQAFSDEIISIIYCHQRNKCNECEYKEKCNNEVKNALEQMIKEVE